MNGSFNYGHHPALERAFDSFDHEIALLLSRQAPLEEYLKSAENLHRLERVEAHIREQVNTGDWDGVE